MEADRAEGVDVARAHWAQWGVCLARTDPDAPKHKGITYFLVDMSTPGIDIRPLREITGDDLFNEVFFDDVFVPDEMVVGEVNDGWRLARTTLANERVAMAHGTALGNPMEELLRTVADARARPGRAGPPRPADRRRPGRLAARPAHRAARGRRRRPGAAGQRPQADRRAVPAGAVGVPDGPVRGRRALVENKPVHDFLNVRCLTIAGGTEQILLTMAGERLLGLPR